MRSLYIDNGGTIDIDLTTEQITTALHAEQGLLWVDLSGVEEGRSYETLLTETFGFHPLAVDDALHESHVPKLDDWESYLYLVLQDGIYTAGQEEMTLPELDVFLGPYFLVSYHRDPLPAVERVWSDAQRDPRFLSHGADHLLYRMIDAIVDDFDQIIDLLEDGLAALEDQLFAEPTSSMLETLFDLKRVIMQMRRVLPAQREVVGKLARDTYPFIGPKDRIFFRDVYDHMIRLSDLSENLRELSLTTMDIYLSMVNNRMNDVVKTLTVITTLFMPLTFLSGFFGMNFFAPYVDLPAWTGAPAFVAVLLLMVLLPVIMLLWMRNRAWT